MHDFEFMAIRNLFGSGNQVGISLFVFTIFLLFVFWGSIALDNLGFSIPLLRQFASFVLITFMPGILILRILRIHNLGAVETIVYATGLSLATLIFTGFFMSMVYPIFGIIRPLSLWPVVATINVLIISLCFLAWIRDRNSMASRINFRRILSPPVLGLSLLPFCAIFGTYLTNFYSINSLLMILILIISFVPMVIVYTRFIPEKYYPFAVFSVSIALLYHTSLISIYIWGWDIHDEYYLANTIIKNGFWDSAAYGNLNAMLDLTMLLPIYSNMCGVSLTWIFKIIYPLLFAFVPLVLYEVFLKQTNNKIAFLSCFFFMSYFVFYGEMLALARQQIAELFLALLVLLMISKNLDKIKRSFLIIVFSMSLAVSHYGLSYIYMFCLILVWLILVSGENQTMCKMMCKIYPKFWNKMSKNNGNLVPLNAERTISFFIVTLFIIFTISWYIYISDSSAFDGIVRIGNQIVSTIITDFLDPIAAEGLAIMISKTASPLHSVTKYLHIISQIFILVGVVALLSRRKKMKLEREYEAFVLVNFMICIAGIALPYFASSLNTTRLYQIALIFLAPFCITGGIEIFKNLNRVRGTSLTERHMRKPLELISVFLAIFLLFNSGWIYEVARDHPNSIALSMASIKNNGDINTTAAYYGIVVPEQDVFSAMWLSNRRTYGEKIYGTFSDSRIHALASYGMIPIDETLRLTNTTEEIDENSYVYLQYLNVIEGIGTEWYKKKGYIYNINEINHLLNGKRKIYSNGGSMIYK